MKKQDTGYKIQENKSLKPFNTLQLEASARYFCIVKSVNQLEQVLSDSRVKGLPIFVLGSGSNTLFSKDFDGIVIKNELFGYSILEEDEETVLLEVNSGQDWPTLVLDVVDKGWGGIENLSHIPGTVGAAPVQNIAAYGQNFSDVLESLEYFDLHTQEQITLNREQCKLSYRDSIFKKELADKTFITKVVIRLRKHPEIDTSYYSIGGRTDSIVKELQKSASEPYTIKDISEAVISIRSGKLLDWKTNPTVGSFFINPVVTKEKLESLRQEDPQLQSYPVENLIYSKNHSDITSDLVKIPVGRLLDTLGWKAKVIGNCKVHDEWASIFTHNGKATGQEFLEFTEQIKQDVLQKTGIALESEVKIV